ncbi:hypothetical protein, partial [Streptomyces tendae]|uniref:hypothetical protein n=1 Tax=Streptomyces tendae TaxID=1932 RepID=UPI0036533681
MTNEAQTVQLTVQSRPSSQRADPARRSAGRSDRLCVTSCPQLWAIFQVGPDPVELRLMRDPFEVELVFCGFTFLSLLSYAG